ncbi:Bug family tripartite tricarboxylate transporter substrate binding protein [Granulosicoccus antarcticus]|uniref:Tripartite tricarboxylate transporter family receptor n=1 Tax=Granulosicoccus antarcticus IMCC3135 TaxID=1192854 RepID=A0A2Z2P0N3_9GAMM|nr:tripartite tricarboxylate transporter substrate binding protein [Granulosicoccus antarcticus]ASJ73787.1 hypothetical protein IMCC3135_18540 [Granulosicoccus antarcticus IMCC3135]
MFRKSLMATLSASFLLLSASTVSAAEFPSKPIKIIVPNGAGGSTDITSRLVAQAYTKELGTELAIVNMGGGGTSIGAMEAASAKPDGYTLLSTHEAFLTSSALGVNTMGPASVRPIAQVAKEVIVLAVQKGSGMHSLDEFYSAAQKDHPGDSLNIGISPGAANHFFSLNVLSAIEHDVTFVPTGGGADTLKALLGGTIDAGTFAVSESIEAIRSGDVVPIALYNDERHPDLPDTPTAKELGYDINVGLHYIWYAPAETPDDVVSILAEAMTRTVSDEAFKNNLIERSITPSLLTGTELEEALASRYTQVEELAIKYVVGQ